MTNTDKAHMTIMVVLIVFVAALAYNTFCELAKLDGIIKDMEKVQDKVEIIQQGLTK